MTITSSTRHISSTIAADIAIAITAILLAEGILRLVYPQPLHLLLRGVYQVRKTGFVYRPHSRTIVNNGYGDHEFSVNNWGCRDQDYGAKRPEEWRLLCIGDSFSDNQALEVNQIYPNVLEADLMGEFPERRLSVINAGMAGWGLWHYLDYLKEMLPTIKPDLVVIAMAASGDMLKSNKPKPPRSYELWNGLPVPRHSSIAHRLKWTLSYTNQWLKGHSHAYILFRRLTYWPGRWIGLSKVPHFYPLVTDPTYERRVLAPTTKVLKEIQSLCTDAGVPIVVLDVPRIYEVDQRDRQLRIQLERPDLTRFDIQRPIRVLRGITQSLHIPLYNPTEDLAASREAVYFAGFEHWNVAGNRIVAKGLRAFLEHQGLLFKLNTPSRSAPAVR